MGWIREARDFTVNTLGNLMFAVRRDSASVGSAADGEIAALSVDSTGNLRVTSSGTSTVSGAAAHDAAVSGNPLPIAGVSSAAAPTAVTGDQEVVRLWALRNGALVINLSAASALIGGDATNGLDVDVTRVIPGTSAAHLGKAEDAAHSTADTGVAMLAVRRDTAAAGSDTNGDYSTVNVDAAGHVWVRPRDPTGPFHGQNTVATAGTEEALAASQALTEGVWVKALHGNTGMIYVGDATVSSADGFVLDAGEEVFICTTNLANVSIDADTNGEGVSYIGW